MNKEAKGEPKVFEPRITFETILRNSHSWSDSQWLFLMRELTDFEIATRTAASREALHSAAVDRQS